jgi:hypothetical protein
MPLPDQSASAPGRAGNSRRSCGSRCARGSESARCVGQSSPLGQARRKMSSVAVTGRPSGSSRSGVVRVPTSFGRITEAATMTLRYAVGIKDQEQGQSDEGRSRGRAYRCAQGQDGASRSRHHLRAQAKRARRSTPSAFQPDRWESGRARRRTCGSVQGHLIEDSSRSPPFRFGGGGWGISGRERAGAAKEVRARPHPRQGAAGDLHD